MSNDMDSSDDDCLFHFRKMHHQQRNENDAKKYKIGEEVPRLTRLLMWIPFVQSTISCWRTTISARIQSTLLHISGGASGCIAPYLKRFLKIWLRRIHTTEERCLGSGQFFAASKVNLSTSNVGLWNFSRSAGWPHKNGWINSTPQPKSVL